MRSLCTFLCIIFSLHITVYAYGSETDGSEINGLKINNAEASTLGINSISPLNSELAIKLVVCLFFVLALIYGLAWILKNTAFLNGLRINQEKRLKLLEVLPISGQKSAILLIHIDNEELVIGVTSSNIQCLHTVTKKQHQQAVDIEHDSPQGSNKNTQGVSENNEHPYTDNKISGAETQLMPFSQQLRRLINVK